MIEDCEMKGRMRRFNWIAVSYLTVWMLVANAATPLQGFQEGVTARWKVTTPSDPASYRALHVVDDRVVWVGGSKGQVLKTEDGGETWESVGPADRGSAEFRSIWAWDAKTACIAIAGTPAEVYRTEDGGHQWNKVYQHRSEAAFFDAMVFDGSGRGWILSDPIDGVWRIIESKDQGQSWQEWPVEQLPKAEPGEAAFAASNGAMVVDDAGHLVLVTGGEVADGRASLLKALIESRSWHRQKLESPSSATSGLFAIGVGPENQVVMVGGDYRPEKTNPGIALSSQLRWDRIEPCVEPPARFCSSVVHVADRSGGSWMASGPAGTFRSSDGVSWQEVADEGFHVLRVSPSGKVWGAGSQGRIGRWMVP
jgi:photosystem II stability/assembly factor-like uncharacterized protein